MLDSTNITKPKSHPESTSPRFRGCFFVKIDDFGNVTWLSVPGTRKLKFCRPRLRTMLRRLRHGR